MRNTKLLSFLISTSLTLNFVPHTAFAVDDPLSPYLSVLNSFNAEYGTTYQLATERQLADVGENASDMVDFICSMSETDFYNYLHDAYLIDLQDTLEVENVESDNCYADEIEYREEVMVNFEISPQASYSGTQHYYYSGSASKSFYITASWSYGDGYYRYSPYLSDIGATFTYGSYPYYSPYNSTYSLANSSREMACTFYCTKYIAQYITQGNYIISVNFVAGGGDIWGSTSI